jgi:hypothetical protein
MCINRSWGEIIFRCEIITNYILGETDIRNCPKGTEKMFLVEVLRMVFEVSRNINGKIYFGRGTTPKCFLDVISREKGW